MRFKNKVALITAGANGIGRATAGIMVREGATVIVADNNQGHLDEATEHFVRARELAERNGVPLNLANASLGLASVALDQGHHDDAGLLLGRVSALLAGIGGELNRADSTTYREVEDAVRGALGAERLTALHEAGAATERR